MSRHNSRRARTRSALLTIALAAAALVVTGCARTATWNRGSAEGPSMVLHADAPATVQTPMASAPDMN